MKVTASMQGPFTTVENGELCRIDPILADPLRRSRQSCRARQLELT
jgi:hypothetical protein